ncbi:hypothetical protein KMZ30_10690 [Phycicoccus sp. KQZ13P-1]|uniref:hypothetical protein n=1 Tax=Phycicoccus mangrovi TaxID=2840470 RepID=UPI001C001949|nr:hypothetical protein [Phycicoccus mangrovi]MBT9254961.1 hypothetical protein [Phycicoccus mangrovi]MBT9256042.1 hypothetical protein [Phycicoccus mangrovi]
MNWDALGKAIGWLPGAAVGSLVGGVFAAVTFGSFATSCPIGGPFTGIGGAVTQLSQECVRSPFGDMGLVAYLTAMAFLGAAVGVVLHAALHRDEGHESPR